MRKRYHRLMFGLDNDNGESSRYKDGKHTRDKSVSSFPDPGVGGCIYVRSHEMRPQISSNVGCGVKHMVTVNTSTRPLWKKAVSQRYLCRQARPLCGFFEHSGHLKEQERRPLYTRKIHAPQASPESKEPFSLSGITRYTRYKRVFLQARGDVERTGSILLAPTTLLSRVTSIYSLNTSRERARRERVSLLKACKSGIFEERKPKERSLQRGWGETNPREQGAQLSPQTQSTFKAKSIWRDFNSTFMRHGYKLRYQTVLRRALLVS